MQKARSLFNTLKIAGHCLCEQGYSPVNLIEIAEIVESVSGIPAAPAVSEIQQTVRFHVELDRQEREAKRQREREIKLQEKQENFFNELPMETRAKALMVCENNYWRAVEFASKQLRKGDKQHGQVAEK